VIVCESLGDFDAVLSWLASFPEGKPRKAAVVTNAGFESVVSADLVDAPLEAARLTAEEEARLEAMIEQHGLKGIVGAHLPLDLTPMAGRPPTSKAPASSWKAKRTAWWWASCPSPSA